VQLSIHFCVCQAQRRKKQEKGVDVEKQEEEVQEEDTEAIHDLSGSFVALARTAILLNRQIVSGKFLVEAESALAALRSSNAATETESHDTARVQGGRRGKDVNFELSRQRSAQVFREHRAQEMQVWQERNFNDKPLASFTRVFQASIDLIRSYAADLTPEG
jgi:hypothetical protein